MERKLRRIVQILFSMRFMGIDIRDEGAGK